MWDDDEFEDDDEIEDGDTVISLVEDPAAPGELRPVLWVKGEDADPNEPPEDAQLTP